MSGIISFWIYFWFVFSCPIYSRREGRPRGICLPPRGPAPVADDMGEGSLDVGRDHVLRRPDALPRREVHGGQHRRGLGAVSWEGGGALILLLGDSIFARGSLGGGGERLSARGDGRLRLSNSPVHRRSFRLFSAPPVLLTLIVPPEGPWRRKVCVNVCYMVPHLPLEWGVALAFVRLRQKGTRGDSVYTRCGMGSNAWGGRWALVLGGGGGGGGLGGRSSGISSRRPEQEFQADGPAGLQRGENLLSPGGGAGGLRQRRTKQRRPLKGSCLPKSRHWHTNRRVWVGTNVYEKARPQPFLVLKNRFTVRRHEISSRHWG